MLNPLGGGFGADFFYAGHVIDGVAHQGQIVYDAFRRYTKLANNAISVEFFAAHGIHQRDMIIHKLCQIFVAGGNEGVYALLRGLFG